MRFFFFFFNDTATTEIYTLSLHDALPIWRIARGLYYYPEKHRLLGEVAPDRKSTRLNSSHHSISYAVFCLKKKNDGKCERERGQRWDAAGRTARVKPRW